MTDTAPTPTPSTSNTKYTEADVTPVNVVYCAICSFPAELCEFGSTLSKCKKWLSDTHPDLYSKYYAESEIPREQLTDKEKEDLDKKEKEAAKKEAKEAAKEERKAKKKAESQIVIKRINRQKRKFVTAINGLQAFGVDMKKTAKVFANKFATGASVAANPQGEDEVVIQGDVAYEVEEILTGQDAKLKDAIFGKDGEAIPEDNVSVVDETKKKSQS